MNFHKTNTPNVFNHDIYTLISIQSNQLRMVTIYNVINTNIVYKIDNKAQVKQIFSKNGRKILKPTNKKETTTKLLIEIDMSIRNSQSKLMERWKRLSSLKSLQCVFSSNRCLNATNSILETQSKTYIK